ncbi:ArsR/SmtB family transcription factor [Streptomyces sp. NPDC058195]|uniref:ArsR/SmtB family transcription factor n=1 Tax=Streptomyces sp. NPDC058195 TaxID=3346375 RepID=UPI0036E6C77D
MHFTMDDLAQLKVLPTVGPVAEAVFATELLRRGGGGAAFSKWRDDVSLRMRRMPPGPTTPRQTGPPAARTGTGGTWLFDLLDQQTAKGGEGITPDPVVRRMLELGVSPYWGKVRAYLQMDREFRCRMMAGGGIETMLSNLHTWMGWRPPSLTIAAGRGEEIHLDGRGLKIVPSMFIDRPRIFTSRRGEPRTPVLVYPTILDATVANALWDAPGTDARALAALVGRTRARVLEALSETCNTSELGRRLGISPAAASQHATVLRGAGLVTSRRRFNTMLHSLTPLGSALVTMGSPVPKPFTDQEPALSAAR